MFRLAGLWIPPKQPVDDLKAQPNKAGTVSRHLSLCCSSLDNAKVINWHQNGDDDEQQSSSSSRHFFRRPPRKNERRRSLIELSVREDGTLARRLSINLIEVNNLGKLVQCITDNDSQLLDWRRGGGGGGHNIPDDAKKNFLWRRIYFNEEEPPPADDDDDEAPPQ